MNKDKEVIPLRTRKGSISTLQHLRKIGLFMEAGLTLLSLSIRAD